VTRWDVDFVIGEFIAELNASHTYRSGGDVERVPSRSVGMLGVDWELTPAKGSVPAAYRIKRIVRGGPWDADVRSPLDEPGVDVSEGDYVLAVNGVPLDPTRDPWAGFQGLGDKTVVLTVSNAPAGGKTRQVVVETLSDETELRFRAWVESGARSWTRRPAAGSATSTCRARACRRRTSWCASSWGSGGRKG
jgi:tricorn protease